MKDLLHKRSLFILLLPIFFVLHGYVEHAGFVEWKSALVLLLTFLAGAGILYLLFRLLLKQPLKAGFMALYCMGVYLFFGAVYDTLKAYSPWSFVYKYSVLLFIFFIAGILLFIALRRTKKDFTRLTFFFNLLFIILIALDIFTGISKQNNSLAKNNNKITGTDIIPDSCDKPDIYLLLFDEYSGNKALKEWFGYDNSAIENYLQQKGFRLIPAARSNYDATSFSMASLLNMEYMNWYRNDSQLLRTDIVESQLRIKHNKTVSLLERNGYEIVNLSIFDLHEQPSCIGQQFLAVNTKLIAEETLLYRLCDEFAWWINKYGLLKKILPVTSTEDQAKNNHQTIDQTCKEAARKISKPKFVYSHFLIPHWPFLYDKHGNAVKEIAVEGDSNKDQITPYLEYLEYGNTQIRKIVDTILHHSGNNAVILLMSDHGYRWTTDPEKRGLIFSSLNAVHLPSRKYDQFTDSITNVNQFRILFNTLFAQNLPVLKDSIIVTSR